MALAAKVVRNQRFEGAVPAGRKGAGSKPKLKVINGGRTGQRPIREARTAPGTAKRQPSAGRVARPAGIAVGLSAVTVCALWIFGLVLLNIYVAQTSFRLNELQRQVTAEQSRFRQLRFGVSSAESPAKLAEAAGELGLVTPERQESLEGRPHGGDSRPGGVVRPASGSQLKALFRQDP